ncbi:MAG TPA: ABC transporter substrate-binding protein [Abditibacteriaceae bacterium]
MQLRTGFCLLMASLVAGGCSREATPPDAATPKPATPKPATTPGKTLPTDDLGRKVTLRDVPQRIVCIGPGATETVYALGLGNRIVGRDSGSDYPAAAQQVPIVADYKGPFFEGLVAQRPDLIVAQGETWGRARIEEWQKKSGAPVVALSATTVEGVARGIVKLGAWLGAPVEATKLAADFKTSTAKPDARWTAFIETQRAPLWSAGRDTLLGDAARAAGLNNIANIRGYKNYSIETLLTQQPMFYVVSGKPAQRASIIADLKRQPGLTNLKCVQAGRVLVVDPDLLLRPSPRLSDGIRALRAEAEKYSRI